MALLQTQMTTYKTNGDYVDIVVQSGDTLRNVIVVDDGSTGGDDCIIVQDKAGGQTTVVKTGIVYFLPVGQARSGAPL